MAEGRSSLAGRDHELEVVRASLGPVTRGERTVVAVEGPPLAGLSAFLSGVTDLARHMGCAVVQVDGHELDAMARSAAADRVGEALSVLAAGAGERPAVLVLDDAQWLGVGDLHDLLESTTPSPGAGRGVVAAFRAPGRPPPSARAVTPVRLGRLGRAVVRDIVRPLHGGGDDVECLVDAAAGLPGLAVALAGGHGAIAARSVLRGLSPPALRLARSIAVVSGPLSSQEVGALAGDASSVGRLVDELRATGVVTGDGRMRIASSAYEAALLSPLGESARRALRRTAAFALAGAGRAAGDREVVSLLRAAAEPPEPAVATRLWRAAAAVGGHDPRLAAALVGEARALCGARDDALAVRLLAAEVEPRLRLGEAARAAELARYAAARLAGRPDQRRMRWWAGRSLLVGGDASAAVAVLAGPAAAATAGAAPALATRALARTLLGDLSGAGNDVDAFRAAVGNGRAPPGAADALVADGLLARSAGRDHDALELLGAAVAVPDDPVGVVVARFAQCMTLLSLDRLEEARAVHGAAIVGAAGLGQLAATVAVALCDLHAGRWSEARSGARAAMASGEDTGPSPFLQAASVVAEVIDLHGGAVEGRGAPPLVPPASAWQAYTVALRLEQAGDDRGALDTLAAALHDPPPVARSELVRTLAPRAVRAAMRLGEHAVAARVAAQASDWASPGATVPASVEAAALTCRGLLTNDAALLEQAVDAHRRSGRALPLAQALEDLGRAQAAGADAVRSAASLFRALGATWDARRVTALLRAHGVPTEPPPRPRAPGARLTATEERVVQLVGRGLTNREIAAQLFISPRTVGTHLAHVYRKLGVRSRTALVARLRQDTEVSR